MSIITWNPDDKADNISLSNNNLTVDIFAQTRGVRATVGKIIGKWYFEIYHSVTSNNNLRIGISTKNFNVNGSVWDDNVIYIDSGESRPNNDVYGVCIDIDNLTMAVHRNGEPLQSNIKFKSAMIGVEVFPHIGMYTRQNANVATANFGATPFVYSIPKEYKPYDIENAKWLAERKILLQSNNTTYSLESIDTEWYETKMASNTASVPLITSESSIFSVNKIYNDVIYPKLTANTQNGYEVTYKSRHSNASAEGFMAFDGSITSMPYLSSGAQSGEWLKIKLPKSRIVKKYNLSCANTGQTHSGMPISWILQGSNNDSEWDDLDIQSSQPIWTKGETRSFTVDNKKSYIYYRLYMISNSYAGYFQIGELELFEEKCYIEKLDKATKQNFIKYGMDVPTQLDGIFVNKNYILQDTVSENLDGLWETQLNRKPLSIKFN